MLLSNANFWIYKTHHFDIQQKQGEKDNSLSFKGFKGLSLIGTVSVSKDQNVF